VGFKLEVKEMNVCCLSLVDCLLIYCWFLFVTIVPRRVTLLMCADDMSSKHACVFCLSIPRGPSKRSLVTFQADDLYSKKSWLDCLLSVCKNASLHVENVDQ